MNPDVLLVGLVALVAGYVIGWRRRGKAEARKAHGSGMVVGSGPRVNPK